MPSETSRPENPEQKNKRNITIDSRKTVFLGKLRPAIVVVDTKKKIDRRTKQGKFEATIRETAQKFMAGKLTAPTVSLDDRY